MTKYLASISDTWPSSAVSLIIRSWTRAYINISYFIAWVKTTLNFLYKVLWLFGKCLNIYKMVSNYEVLNYFLIGPETQISYWHKNGIFKLYSDLHWSLIAIFCTSYLLQLLWQSPVAMTELIFGTKKFVSD